MLAEASTTVSTSHNFLTSAYVMVGQGFALFGPLLSSRD